MANDVEQALIATAEPKECSRWAVIFLLGSVGVTILCLSLYLASSLDNLPVPLVGTLLDMLIMAVGFLLFSHSCIFLVEQYTGGNPHGVMSVDRLLSM
jgi:hypothetical protein